MPHRRYALAAAFTLVVALGAPTAVHAEPAAPAETPSSIEDRQALADELRTRLDEHGAHTGAIAEELNRAQYHLEQLDAEIAAVQAAIDDAEVEVEARRRDVHRRAASAYKRAGTGGALELMDVSDPAERNTRAKYTNAVAASEAALVAALREAQDELAELVAEHEAARAAAKAERDELARAATAMEAATAEQAALLDGVDSEIQALIDEERARQEAEWAALAPPAPPPDASPGPEAGPAPAPAPGPSPPAAGPPPPASGGAQVAVNYAYAQIGKPYCAYPGPRLGPGCFDCSGLTYRAWEAAGVIMPTYSGGQYASYPKVPIHALQPGDLVFWGPGGGSHVGIYVGNGQMIESPDIGGHVRVATIHRPSGGPMGAVRPG